MTKQPNPSKKSEPKRVTGEPEAQPEITRGELLPPLKTPPAKTPASSPQRGMSTELQLDPDNLPEDLAFTPVPRKTKRWAGITDYKQRLFIVHLAGTGSVTMAAKCIGTSTGSMYQLRRAPDAESFAKAWDRAIDMGARRVLDMMMEHSIHGTPEKIIKDGKVVAERRRYNTRAMQWIVQQRFPEQYGGTLNFADVPKSAMPDSLRRLKKKWQKQWEKKYGFHKGHAPAPNRVKVATEEEACAEILKRLKVLNIRLEYAEAYNYVGDPEKQAAYELLKGPQPWDDIAKSKAEKDAAMAKEEGKAAAKAAKKASDGSEATQGEAASKAEDDGEGSG